MNDFKIPRHPIDKDWKISWKINKNDVKDKVVIFMLKDLVEEYECNDRDWLEINLKNGKVCISREGIDYEPHFIGIIKDIGDVF